MGGGRKLRTTLVRALVAMALFTAAVGVVFLLDQTSRASSEIRQEAVEMLMLTELQAQLLRAGGLVADLVGTQNQNQVAGASDDAERHTASDHAATADHHEASQAAQPSPTRPVSDHAALTDHPDLSEALRAVRRSIVELEAVLGEPAVRANLSGRFEDYERAVEELHRSETAQDAMASYHSGAQQLENAIRAEILALEVRETAHLQSAVERSRTADLWMRTLVPSLSLIAAALAGLLVRNQSQRRRREIETLETASREKDNFIASVSHELRTPITGVLGFLELLQDSDTGTPKAERDQMIAIAAREALDLTSLVDDLLVVAKTDTEGLSPARVRVSLGAQVVQVLEGLDAVDGVDVVDDGTLALGDPQRLRQIVRNLITNAMRYGGDNISVSIGTVGDWATLAVSDDGPGIPDEDVERIFQPYQRARNRKGAPASIGLGLAVSRRLAVAMGGRLDCRRTDGYTVFVLELPLLESDGSPGRGVPGTALAGHS